MGNTHSKRGCVTSSPTIHLPIICDGCAGYIRGTRYKCNTCPYYDLCQRCKDKGYHTEHEMATIAAPIKESDQIATIIQQFITGPPQIDVDYEDNINEVYARFLSVVGTIQQTEIDRTSMRITRLIADLEKYKDLMSGIDSLNDSNTNNDSEGHTSAAEAVAAIAATSTVDENVRAQCTPAAGGGVHPADGHTSATSAADGAAAFAATSAVEENDREQSVAKAGAGFHHVDDCETSSPTIHPGIICDGCAGDIRGTRYRCKTCPDYDLCHHCNNQGYHTDHEMASIHALIKGHTAPSMDDTGSDQGTQDGDATAQQIYSHTTPSMDDTGSEQGTQDGDTTEQQIDESDQLAAISQQYATTPPQMDADYGDNINEMYARFLSVFGPPNMTLGQADCDTSSPTIHPGIICDGCARGIRGTRYKCKTCPHYDLCQRCKDQGYHTDHEMYTIHAPIKVSESDRISATIQQLMTPQMDDDNGGGESLVEAATRGEVADVRRLLAGRVEVDWRDESGATALWQAATYGRLDVVRELAACHAQVDVKNRQGFSPLHCAAQEGHVAVVEELCRLGAQVDIAVLDGSVPLGLAAMKGHTEAVKALIKAGATVDYTDATGVTPLYVAASFGNIESVIALLQAGAAIDRASYNGATPLFVAAEKGHADTVSALLQVGATVDYCTNEGHTPMSIATDNDHANVVEAIVGHATTTAENKYGESLLTAAKRGDVEDVKRWIATGVNVDWTNDNSEMPALCWAAMYGHVDVVKELAASGSDLDVSNEDDHIPLHLAAQEGHVAVLEELRHLGADIHRSTSDGNSALHIAAQYGHIDVVNALLQHVMTRNECPPDTDAVADADGVTPLNVAVQNSTIDAVNALQHAGADLDDPLDFDCSRCSCIDKEDERGLTPLFYAACNGYFDVVDALLQNGANVGSDLFEGCITPLHISACNGYTDVVNTLLQHGATLDGCYVHSVTPLFLAVGNGHTDVVNALLQGGALVDFAVGVQAEMTIMAARDAHISEVKSLWQDGAMIEYSRRIGSTPLLVAAEHGHIQIVSALINKNASVNLATENGQTPLSQAAFKGHAEIVHMLLTAGANQLVQHGRPIPLAEAVQRQDITMIYTLLGLDECEIQASEEFTALQWASAAEREDIVAYLLDNDADTRMPDDLGGSHLHQVAESGGAKAMRILIERGADIDATDGESRTPLHVAAAKDHGEVVQVLVDNGADINIQNKNQETPFHVCARCDADSVAEILLRRNTDISIVEQKRHMLRLCVQYDSLNVASLLIENNADMDPTSDEDKGQLLHFCMELNRFAMAKLLLKNRTNVEARDGNGRTALHVCACNGNVNMAELLIKYGCDVNSLDQYTNTPLHLCLDHSISVSQCLLKHGANEAARNIYNETPLHVANNLKQTKLIHALVGLPEGWAMEATDEFDALQWASAADNGIVVTLLLDNPITELSRRDKLGRNALDIAVQTKSFATAKALVGLDNTWNCPGMAHFTAIHWAAAANNAILLNDYIRVPHMDVNIQDSMGRTPLHIAAITDSFLTADILLKANACPTILSNDGDPSLFIAYYYNSRDVFSRLLSHRFDVAGRDGNTMLHIAARLDDSKTIHQLLTVENEGLLELVNDKGDSALHVAVVEDSVEAATILIQRGADTRAINDDEKKPLDLVGEKWKMLYLIQGADMDTTSVGMLGEIHQRVADGDDTLTDSQLVDIITTRCSEGLSLLHVAVLNSKFAMVQRLLRLGADVNVWDSNGISVLHFATRQSQLMIMQLLLQTKSCHIDIIDRLGRSPLHWAASENKFAFVECLLEGGASASLQADDYKTPVHILLENKIDSKVKNRENEKSVSLLLNYMDNTLSPEETADLAASAVSFLIMSENPEFKTDKIDHLLSIVRNCKRLFSSPCYLSNQTKGLLKDVSERWSKYTVFMALVEYYPPERLREFLESATEETINSTNFLQQNVLHLLTEKHLDGTESNEMVKKASMLIGRNIDVTQSDINSRTPLHLACQNQNHMLGLCLLKSLSKKGSLTSVNNKDIMGRTALHLLLRKGQDMIQSEECDDLIKHLFACGADPIVQDYNGESALECGYALRLESIVTYSPSLLLDFPQITQIKSTLGSMKTQTINELPKGLREINVVNEHNINNWISTLNESYSPSSVADIFLKSTELGPLKKTYTNRANAERVGRFVQDLCSKALSDMSVKGHIEPGGSMAEGTKVGAVDEMDFLLRLTDMEELVNVVGIECRGGSPFARLSTKTTNIKSADEAFKVLKTFLQALEGLSSLPDYGISLEDIKRNKLKVFTLCLKCSQKSADDLKVTVDIVPSITKELDYHPRWNPTVKPKHGECSDARETCQNVGEAEMGLEREVENNKCHSQVDVSHLNFPLLMKRDGFEVSFLELEHQALQQMEPYKQNTYMLLKAMRTDDICPRLTSIKKETTIEDILPSYIFKMGLLWVLDPVGKKADHPDFTDDESEFPSEETNTNEKIRHLALEILKLLSARGRDTIPSYFCPSCKLRLTHNCKLLCRIMSGVLKGHP